MTEENKEDLAIREEADGSVTVGDTSPPQEESNENDERLSHNADDTHHDEEQAADGESEEDAEARRERNRQRRKDSKERRKDYIESLKRELASRDTLINDMNTRLATVERRSTGSEMAQLDQAEKEATIHYNQFKELHGKAVEQANGHVATEATEKMMAARQRLDQIGQIKKAMQTKQAQPAPLDPRLVNQAQDWMQKNNWYDPSGNDEDSSIVLALDNRLAKEGWNPTTPEYWNELDSRVKKYLPHRSDSGYNSRTGSSGMKTATKSPVAGSGRESGGANSNSSGYRLSAERVSALKDAGLWNDMKSRTEAIKRFQQLDREQKGA